MIKILATSDWHLGNTFHGFDRQEEHADFLRWLLGVVEQKAPDALLVSGDIFDSSNPSAASQELYYNFLDTLTQRFHSCRRLSLPETTTRLHGLRHLV